MLNISESRLVIVNSSQIKRSCLPARVPPPQIIDGRTQSRIDLVERHSLWPLSTPELETLRQLTHFLSQQESNLARVAESADLKYVVLLLAGGSTLFDLSAVPDGVQVADLVQDSLAAIDAGALADGVLGQVEAGQVEAGGTVAVFGYGLRMKNIIFCRS